MIDFSLTEEQLSIQRTARDFAQEKMKPVGVEADRIPDPREVWPKVAEVVKMGIDLGFHTMVIPTEYGGGGVDHRTIGIVWEELGAGDVGIGGNIGISNIAWLPLLIAGTEEQKRKWLTEVCSDTAGMSVGCWGATEPSGLAFSVDAFLEGGAAVTVQTAAKPEGNSYVINGQKSFITGGGIAKVCTLLANTPEGPTHFFVPTDTRGLTVGKQEDMMGFRCLNDVGLFFDDMRIPKENLVGEQGGNGVMELLGTLGYSDPWVAALSNGITRAAYEAAFEYSKIRVLTGKPIIRFQTVSMMLADMFLELEASRDLTWKSLWYNDTHPTPDHKLAMAAKIFATDTAMKVTTDAIQVYGGAGYMKENPVEKYMRDAKIMQIFEGTNQLLRIFMGAFLYLGM